MEELDPHLVSQALVVWLGYGDRPYPDSSDERLSERIGSREAAKLLPRVRQLVEEFYESDACHFAPDLETMAGMASAPFEERHPELSAEAVEALAWSYTYDFK